MSRAIEIKVSESVTRVIHIEDKVQTSLEVLDLLGEEESSNNLGETLQEHGFERDPEEEDTWVRRQEDVTIRVNSKNREVQASIDHEEEVTEEGSSKSRGYDDTRDLNRRNEASARDNLKKKLDEKIDETKQKKQNKLTEQLEKTLGELKPELREISQKTNKKNLQQKARQIGQVESSSESEDGGLTIRVKV